MEILGYIYIIQSLCYGKRLKIGSTRNINRRKWDYHTYVPDEVYYNSYFCIINYGKFKGCKDPLRSIETTIQEFSWFKERRSDQKKEFFIHDNSIEEFVRNIEYLLDVHEVIFKPIYKDEIYNRPVIEKYEYFKEDIINNEINDNFQLRDYQEECIGIMKSEKIGKFILPTGSGKTVIFLSYLKEMGGTNLVLVPFIELVNQTYEKAKCFGFDKIVRICQGKKQYWGDKRGKNILYISTYQSSDKKVYSLCDLKFNNMIYDETHYTVLTGENENSMFQHVLKNGKGEKKFFFTATEKNIKVKIGKNVNISNVEEDEKNKGEKDEKEISMDNVAIYGETLYSMSIDEAIKKNIICDYNINIWLHRNDNKEETVKKIIEKKPGDKILIFCSTVNKMKYLAEYLDSSIYRENHTDYYINYADGKMSEKERKEILSEFKGCKGVSVLVLCGLFKVGFDLPCIDTIIHYDKCTSTIDLIQKNGRCLRKFTGKIKGTIILLTNIDAHDTDIIHYKKMLNYMSSYDKRIKDVLMGLKEKNDQGIYSTIKIMYNFEDTDLYGIYDKYMNFISGYNNVIKKMGILIEYRLKEKKWPDRNIKYKDIKLGKFLNNLKYFFIKPIKIEKRPIYYDTEQNQLIKMLKNAELYDEILNSVNVNINVKQKITPIEKIKKTIEYRKNKNKWPNSSLVYDHIEIGYFWNNFKPNFIRPIKMGEEPISYKTEKEQMIQIIKKAKLWEEMLSLVKSEKRKKKGPIKNIDKLIEYRVNKNKWPIKSKIYNNVKIGNFLCALKGNFIRPIKMGEEPISYKTEKEQIIQIIKKAKLWGEMLSLVKSEIKIYKKITPIERMKKTIEHRLQKERWIYQKEIYKDIKLGNFWSNFKVRIIKPIKNNETPTGYPKERDKMIQLLHDAGLYEDAFSQVS